MNVNVLYFARLRETFNLSREHLALPDGARVADLLDLLRTRGGDWPRELAPGRSFRVAVDQDIASQNSVLREGAEVAIFPPVTGG
jgi:molybdopterin converting factor subunit 1